MLDITGDLQGASKIIGGKRACSVSRASPPPLPPQPNDQSDEEIFELRIETNDMMMTLCGKRERQSSTTVRILVYRQASAGFALLLLPTYRCILGVSHRALPRAPFKRPGCYTC